MRTLLLAILAGWAVAATPQAILLKSTNAPKPFIELIGAGALVSCNSEGLQPPAPCNKATGDVQLSNASASLTTYIFDSLYTLRGIVSDAVPQLGGGCNMQIKLNGQVVLTGTASPWSGSVKTNRVEVLDPTGSRCLIRSLKVWAEAGA